MAGRRSPIEAVGELAAAAAAGLDDPVLRDLALAAMADIGGSEAEAAVRGVAVGHWHHESHDNSASNRVPGGRYAARPATLGVT